jgi:hypothetical protein
MGRHTKRLAGFGTCPATALLLVLVGCRPAFEATGTLSIDGVPWRPNECHVLTRCTGIELVDAQHRRIELTMRPQALNAWRRISGSANVRWSDAGRAPSELGQCGDLTMRGEGYHGDGKRAASGRVSFACTGKVVARGALDFSGCF